MVCAYRAKAGDQRILMVYKAIFRVGLIELVPLAEFIERQIPSALVDKQPFAEQVELRNLLGVVSLCGYDCSIFA